MPTVPHPDPRHPVVWADTPGVPDATSTPAISGLPDDDDPIQFNLDEALVRKADNDTVHRWKALAGPWFDARGGDAASRWRDIEQSLNEIVRRPLGELDTVRQRNMYRDIMAPRLEAWGDEARAHASREAQAFNDAASQQRQDLALAGMRRGAKLNDMQAVAESQRRLIEEVRGRNRRQRLDPDAANSVEADALGAAHADVVEHLAQHDPQRAQDWLNARAATIGDPGKVDRLSRMLQPYVAEQQQEGLADLIRGEGGDLPAQHAAVDAMGLDPAITDGLKQRLADMTEGDRRAGEKEQDAAFSRVKTAALNPETQSLRGISPADYYGLTPDKLDVVHAVMAANLWGAGPTANPELYRGLSDRAAQGSFSSDDIRRFRDILPEAAWNKAVWTGEIGQPSIFGQGNTASRHALWQNQTDEATQSPGEQPGLRLASADDWHRDQLRPYTLEGIVNNIAEKMVSDSRQGWDNLSARARKTWLDAAVGLPLMAAEKAFSQTGHEEAASLLREFRLGLGPRSRTFGPNDAFTIGFANSITTQEHIQSALADWKKRPGGLEAKGGAYTNYKGTFVPIEAGDDDASAPVHLIGSPEAHVIGSFNLEGRLIGKDRIRWTAKSNMTLTSFFADNWTRRIGVHLVENNEHPEPYGTTGQTITWITDLNGSLIGRR